MNNEDNEYDFCIDMQTEILIYDGNDLFNGLTGEKIDKNQKNIEKNSKNIIQDIENNTLPREDSKIFYETKFYQFPYNIFLDSYFSCSCSNYFVYIINRIKYLYGCITGIIKKPPNIISMENGNKNET